MTFFSLLLPIAHLDVPTTYIFIYLVLFVKDPFFFVCRGPIYYCLLKNLDSKRRRVFYRHQRFTVPECSTKPDPISWSWTWCAGIVKAFNLQK